MTDPRDPNPKAPPSGSADKVLIFDTTLRDGEQSPGISLNTQEKLEIAQQLARLGVDVIEAGFPVSSEGEFEAVRDIAGQVKGSVIAGLANKEIAAALDLSPNTVAVHRANIMNALGIHKTAELVAYAIRSGLVNVP